MRGRAFFAAVAAAKSDHAPKPSIWVTPRAGWTRRRTKGLPRRKERGENDEQERSGCADHGAPVHPRRRRRTRLLPAGQIRDRDRVDSHRRRHVQLRRRGPRLLERGHLGLRGRRSGLRRRDVHGKHEELHVLHGQLRVDAHVLHRSAGRHLPQRARTGHVRQRPYGHVHVGVPRRAGRVLRPGGRRRGRPAGRPDRMGVPHRPLLRRPMGRHPALRRRGRRGPAAERRTSATA